MRKPRHELYVCVARPVPHGTAAHARTRRQRDELPRLLILPVAQPLPFGVIGAGAAFCV